MNCELVRAKELTVLSAVAKMLSFENAGRTDDWTEPDMSYVDALNEAHDSLVDICNEILPHERKEVK